MEPGSIGSDRYELQELLGAGASSRVYRAFDRQTRTTVAVKVLNPHLRTDEISIERLRRELQITRHINHPRILAIYDLVNEPDRTFAVMELLDGRSLKDYIALEHPIPVATVRSCLKQVLEVLVACHARDVIHRDLKPQNIFIDDKEQLKLLDFGIARMTSLRDLTKTGTSLGSPEYMAPELFAASTYDPRTDLYALGVIGFELLAGRLPFQGDTLANLFHAHRSTPVPALGELRDDVPEWLTRFIEKLLAKRGHERYQSAEEALDDLNRERVISRELPQLPQRPCLECDQPTLEDLSICIRCGADRLALRETGTSDLRFKLGEDPQALGEFVSDALDLKVEEPRRRQTLLLRGIGRRLAERLRAKAARRGIYLEVCRSGRLTRWLGSPPIVIAYLAVFWGAIPYFCFEFRDWWPEGIWGFSVRWTLLGAMLLRFLFLLVGLISVCAGPYLTWRRIAGRRPLIADPGQRLARRLRSYQWLERIAPVLAKSPSGSRSALSGMVEKYLLLVRKRPRGKRDTGEASERLRGVLEATADLEGLAREIESQLDDAELARVTQRYDALQARLDACVDVRDQEALAREKAALADQLAAFSRLDEMHSSLSNRLIHAEAVFNRLVGAQLVLQAPYDEVELESLADSLQRVRLEIEAQCELSGTGDAVA